MLFRSRLDAGEQPACVQSCPVRALRLVDIAALSTTDAANAVQYPAGYPEMPQVNPSTRFIMPRTPRVVRR